MKKISAYCLLFIIICLNSTGCSRNLKKDLQFTIKMAVADVEILYEAELAECPDPNNCPGAERYREFADYGYALNGILDAGLTEDNKIGIDQIFEYILSDLDVSDSDERAIKIMVKDAYLLYQLYAEEKE